MIIENMIKLSLWSPAIGQILPRALQELIPLGLLHNNWPSCILKPDTLPENTENICTEFSYVIQAPDHSVIGRNPLSGPMSSLAAETDALQLH